MSTFNDPYCYPGTEVLKTSRIFETHSTRSKSNANTRYCAVANLS